MDEMSLWLTPLILLPGVALLIMSTSARFNRLHDEVHDLAHHEYEASAGVAQHLLKRARLFRNTLVSLYTCVATFALASLLGMVAALVQPENNTAAWTVLGMAAVGILCLGFAALLLIRESILSLEIIEAHREAFKGDLPHPDHEHGRPQ